MKRRNIARRKRKWRKEEINKVFKLCKDGKTFKEIAEEFNGEKTYNAIRNTAYKVLRIKSNYNPAIISRETRQKISASLQGLELEKWSGFKETNNALIRKSIPYKNWREKIFKRDNYTCKKCSRGGGIYLVAHHIVNFSSNFNKRMALNNGVTLCKECHIDFHNQYGRFTNNIEQLKDYLKSKAIDLILDYEKKVQKN